MEDKELEEHIDNIMVELLSAVDYLPTGNLKRMREIIGSGLKKYKEIK